MRMRTILCKSYEYISDSMTVKMRHLIVTIAFLMMFGQGVIGAATAKPLEHSPGELAWAAWLQEDTKQPDSQPPPRRITTKSLFVFPNLGPEALPACADGYRPDSMGRCIKLFKPDETAHLEFLLQKLNSKFATETSDNQEDIYDYDIETEIPDTAGPFQFNIPIAQPQGPKPEDSEGSGDTIMLFKKEAPPSVISASEAKPPVSSPEYVPGDKETTQNNEADASEHKDDIVKNSTDTKTIVVSTNGKFENVTAENDKMENIQNNVTKIIEDIKNSTNDQTAIDIEKVVDKVLDAATTTILKTLFEEISGNHTVFNKSSTIEDPTLEKKDGSSTINSTPDTNKSTMSTTDKIEKSDMLVDEIEALKDDLKNQNNTSDAQNNEKDDNIKEKLQNEKVSTDDNSEKVNDKKSGVLPQIDLDIEKDLGVSSSEPLNIEDKIKVISRFADVTRNTEEDAHVLNQDQKKTSNNLEIYPYIPQPQNRVSFYASSSERSGAPSNLVRFPTNSKNNHIASQGQYSAYDKNYPYNPHKPEYPSGNIRHKPPYWWVPHSWNVEQQPRDEHNLMSFWSRMPLIPEYPYVNSAEHNRHPPHYQSLYQNSHETGGRINLRHTSINHRRGRLYNRDRQAQHEEPFIYARGRHPHYRE